MQWKKIYFWILLTFLIAGGLPVSGHGKDEGLVLAKKGETAFTICLADDAIASERMAAEQLQKYLGQVTGAEFAILNEKDVPADRPQILVGAGRRVKKLLPQEDWEALGTDGIVVKSIGGNLILAGGRPRGTLYAVFQFLEETVGCRWWTPTAQTIPTLKGLPIPPQDLRYVPGFSYREYFSTAARYHPEFATILRQNGSNQQQSSDWGGHFEILGFVHTFAKLLPPETYFDQHPEWFPDPTNGFLPCTKDSPRPEGQKTQLCLSNPEVLAELTKNALELIQKNPEAGYISISQNDFTAFCRCPDCMKIAEREGSQSGPILKFVNAVAEKIGKHYPDFWVETLAYTYSEAPPKTIRPAKNVLIRLALALADYGHPIDSEWNVPARDKILAWAKIAPHLFLWTYGTNFQKVIFPHPNLQSWAEDFRYFSEHNVRGIFFQGNCYSGEVGDFAPLRTWLAGHLLWNPDQDQKALVAEFLAGYYGAAAPYLGKYLSLIENQFLAQERGLNTNNRDFSFFNLEVSQRAQELFTQAKDAVAGDEVLQERVAREELSPLIARIFNDRALRAEARAANLPYPSREEVNRELEEFAEKAEDLGTELWGERITVEEGLAEIRGNLNPVEVELPEFVHSVSREDVMDFQPSMMTLSMEGNLTAIEEDPAASGGKATRMVTRSNGWLVQAHLGSYLDTIGDEWHIYAVLKPLLGKESTGKGDVLEGGLYSDSGMTNSGRFKVNFRKLSKDQYTVVDLGVHKLDPGMMLWFAPLSSAPADGIFFDRILFVRESATKEPKGK